MAMERVTVEQNGERFTLEVAEGTSDAEITSYITGQQGSLPSTPSPATAAVQTVAPALATPGTPTGLGSIASQVKQAVVPEIAAVGKNIIQGYKAAPAGAIADAVLLHAGIPPVFGGYKGFEGMYDLYKGAKNAVSGVGDIFSKLPAGTEDVAKPFVNALSKSQMSELTNLVNSQGLEKGLKTFQPAGLSDEAMNSLNAVRQSFPSLAGKIGQVAGPVLRGAGKVLGPVGMGMNMYDAAQMARETQLGQRLATGQGQQAQQNFRQMNTPYGAPISAPEAQNVLQSGSPRDIQAFGGQERLNQMIREAAAKKALAFPNQ
jgi:hypothetical protein